MSPFSPMVKAADSESRSFAGNRQNEGDNVDNLVVPFDGIDGIEDEEEDFEVVIRYRHTLSHSTHLFTLEHTLLQTRIHSKTHSNTYSNTLFPTPSEDP